MLEAVNDPTGEIEQTVSLFVKSKVLEGNRAAMEPVRPLRVYLPPEAKATEAYPVLYCLAPWTSAGRDQLSWQPFRESLFERLNRLILTSKMPPCVVVFPDLYTEFGGSQFINSHFFGHHGDFIVKELIPFIEKEFPVRKGPGGRGVFGRSSGGFGAIRLAMDYPGTFSGVACHSGDMGFELLYGAELISVSQHLRRFGYQIEAFLEYCWQAPKLSRADTHSLMLLGMAGFYSSDEHSLLGFDYPIDLQTGLRDERLWGRWLAEDPLQRLDATHESLSELKALYLDCGNRDEYNLQYGARQFSAKLHEYNINHLYAEFDDGHSGTAYRYDESLPLIVSALSNDS